MSELEQATQRLQSALERLERAAETRAVARGDGDQPLSELREKLSRTADEKARLQSVAEQAGDRLTSAIGRLDSLLGD